MDTFIDRGEGYVMIKELTILHQHQSVSRMKMRHVSVDHNGHQAGRWQWLVTD